MDNIDNDNQATSELLKRHFQDLSLIIIFIIALNPSAKVQVIPEISQGGNSKTDMKEMCFNSKF